MAQIPKWNIDDSIRHHTTRSHPHPHGPRPSCSSEPKCAPGWFEQFQFRAACISLTIQSCTPDTPCVPCMPISWGGLGGQCRHIWQSHGASGYYSHTWPIMQYFARLRIHRVMSLSFSGVGGERGFQFQPSAISRLTRCTSHAASTERRRGLPRTQLLRP